MIKADNFWRAKKSGGYSGTRKLQKRQSSLFKSNKQQKKTLVIINTSVLANHLVPNGMQKLWCERSEI